MTEASPVLTVSRPSGRLEKGVGKPAPSVELRIDGADDQGIGEIVARGPNVMAGYTDDEATREAIDAEGWLHTGDVGRLDKKGRLEILGRLKDVVISANSARTCTPKTSSDGWEKCHTSPSSPSSAWRRAARNASVASRFPRSTAPTPPTAAWRRGRR